MSNILQKQGLSSSDQMILHSEFESKKKSHVILFLLWFFLATVAAHRFYLGDTNRAILMLIFGVFTLFIWNLIDIIFAWKRLDQVNAKIERQLINKIKRQ